MYTWAVVSNTDYVVCTVWANNLNFPPHTDSSGNPLQIGFDPISEIFTWCPSQTYLTILYAVGTNDSNAAGRVVLGTNPDSQSTDITLPVEFVLPKGGAYFFVPSISALQTKLSV